MDVTALIITGMSYMYSYVYLLNSDIYNENSERNYTEICSVFPVMKFSNKL